MEMHHGLFALLAFGVLLVCMIGAWSRRNVWYRWGLIALSVAVVLGSYPVVTDLLSRPKPVSDEWYYKEAKRALITGIYIDEGIALYLYLKLPEIKEPRSYKYPWNEETRKLAKKLQEQLEGPEGDAGVILGYPFQPSQERERREKGDEKFPPMEPQKAQPPAPFQFGS